MAGENQTGGTAKYIPEFEAESLSKPDVFPALQGQKWIRLPENRYKLRLAASDFTSKMLVSNNFQSII